MRVAAGRADFTHGVSVMGVSMRAVPVVMMRVVVGLVSVIVMIVRMIVAARGVVMMVVRMVMA